MYASNQFPVKPKPVVNRATGTLWYYPTQDHPGQLIMSGRWSELEQERKRLSCMGYKYKQFKKRYK